MPLYVSSRENIPDAWRIWGHSWFSYTVGPSSDQTGRVDALLRSRFDIEFMNFRNYAGNGARAIVQGASTSGTSINGGSFVRMYRYVQPTRTGAPYAPDGGANLICFGINDLGTLNGSLALTKSAYIHGMRAMISRARSSKVWLNTSGAPLAYGAGFTATGLTEEMGSIGTMRVATTTTASTITFTLPADYTGEAVAFSFLGRGALAGGVITWSGTALSANPANGTTTDLSGVIDAAWFTHTPVVKRITGLTSANANQTIIATVTSVGSSTPTIYFDSVWLESKTPPPVIVLNIARIPDTQMTALTAGGQVYQSWSGTNSSRDADVVAVNASLVSLAGEFDSMVQVADVDSVIGKDASKTSDGIHPNEHGGGEIVDAIAVALNAMVTPVGADSQSLAFHSPAPRTGTQRRSRLVGYPYTSDLCTAAATGTAVAAAGTGYWIPFQVTESRDQYNQFRMGQVAVGTVAGSVRVGVYDDPEFSGYPQTLPGLTDFGLISLTLVANTMKVLTPTFAWAPDPGLYWLCMVVVTQGTGVTIQMLTTSVTSMFLPNRPTGTGGNVASSNWVGWTGTGISTTALPQRAPLTLTLATTVPLLEVVKSK